jgi:hypothetical protein
VLLLATTILARKRVVVVVVDLHAFSHPFFIIRSLHKELENRDYYSPSRRERITTCTHSLSSIAIERERESVDDLLLLGANVGGPLCCIICRM